jgi:pyruvate ferredoxin oxidoreductase delta subunit
MDIKELHKRIALGVPKEGEAGPTGEWRVFKPVINKEKCIAYKKNSLICQICWKFCPDATIEQGTPPKIDYVYCKGCGICAEECPSKAIEMQEENQN